MGKRKGDGGGENWLQGLIASALMMGISKRALMEDYYMDEIGLVIEAWNKRHGVGEDEEEVDAMSFLGDGGEWVG